MCNQACLQFCHSRRLHLNGVSILNSVQFNMSKSVTSGLNTSILDVCFLSICIMLLLLVRILSPWTFITELSDVRLVSDCVILAVWSCIELQSVVRSDSSCVIRMVWSWARVIRKV